MAVADWIIVIVLAISVLTAFREGFFVSLFSLGGLILGLMLASWHYLRLMPFVGRFVHSKSAAEAVSFLLIALVVMVACGIVGRLLRMLFHTIGLGWADRVLGAAFGFLRGAVLVTIAVMALAAFLPHLSWLDESRLARYFLSAAHQTAVVTPSDLADRIRTGVKTLQEAQPDWLRPKA
jgi:membrane protein required for colicin V production